MDEDDFLGKLINLAHTLRRRHIRQRDQELPGAVSVRWCILDYPRMQMMKQTKLIETVITTEAVIFHTHHYTPFNLHC